MIFPPLSICFFASSSKKLNQILSVIKFLQLFSDVIDGEEFANLSSQAVGRFISSDKLTVSSEEKVNNGFIGD